MTNFRFTLEYDGTNFEGWQIQAPGQRTAQGCLRDALTKIAGEPVTCMGSGRTDAGVHAEGQVASSRFATRLDTDELRRALNANLPDDMVVLSVAAVPDDFDARRNARSKHYRYRVWNHPLRSPLRAGRSWWVRGLVDVGGIRAALPTVLGEHDFTSFQGSGSAVRTPVREVFRAEVSEPGGAEIQFDFEANGFLRYMVRNLVGTAVEIGLGRRDPGDLAQILAARDRTLAGARAPAQGLTLVSVDYA